MADREPVIGIDLGTTNCVVATVQGGMPVVIPGRSGQRLTPSVVAVTPAGKSLVGQLAKRQAITNPTETVYATKRLIGRKFSSGQVQQAMKTLAYPVLAGAHDDIRLRLGGKDLSLPEIAARLLAELKLDAEAFLGRQVRQAVVTVPAYFNDSQRQATKDAGRIAGLDVLRILNEPTAAAVAYGFGRKLHGKIAVFDLGGGTFDVSVLTVNDGVFDVAATGGDSYLGGEDFDQRLIEHLVLGFAKEHGVDLRKDRMALQRLKDAAEKAKIELSAVAQAQIHLPFLSTPPGGTTALHLAATLTREALEAMTGDLSDRAVAICGRVLEDAKVKPAELREILLVGGMTRMPRIVEAVRAFFGREPSKGVHPEEVVALGAAVHAESLVSGKGEVLLLDVTPHSLGVAVAGGFVRRLIPKNTTVPTAVTERFNTSKDQQTTVRISVLQGESEVAHENELIGEFVLSGLRQAPRGAVEIEVTFDIDAEGIVSVSARDRETGQQQSITVTASGGLTRDELGTILEERSDEALSVRSTEAVSTRRLELVDQARAVQLLVPRVRAATTGTDFGAEVLARAERALAAAGAAHPREDLAALDQALEGLIRVRTVLEGVLVRAGGVR